MSHFEEYVVDITNELSANMFELGVHPKPGSTAPTAVSRILLIKGATDLTNRKGIELGNGATINLRDDDFEDALDNIDIGDIVNYLSDPIPSLRPPARASIQYFNFPMDTL